MKEARQKKRLHFLLEYEVAIHFTVITFKIVVTMKRQNISLHCGCKNALEGTVT